MRRCIVKYSHAGSVHKRGSNFVTIVPADGLVARLSAVGVLGEELDMFMSKFLWLPTIPYHIREYD